MSSPRGDSPGDARDARPSGPSGPSDDPSHLFVYGTLLPGADAPPEARRALDAGAEPAGEARVRGRLYEAGGGRYPAAVRSGADRWVRGVLYRLRAPELVLRVLDRYEGRRPDGTGLFAREVVRARRLRGAGGETDAGTGEGAVSAWAYLYNRDPSELEEIECGDWRQR